MRLRDFVVFAVMMISVLAALPVQAHVPVIAGTEEGPGNAVYISDPTKSWAFYSSFDEADSVIYYRFNLDEGDRLWVSVFTPGRNGVFPGVVISGRGIDGNTGELPAGVEIEKDAGYISVGGVYPEKPGYEPFTPSANYRWLEYEYIAGKPGDYYVALVNSGTSGGSVGLAIGYREEFSPAEWLLIPASKMRIAIWEGYDPAFIILFPVFVVMAGLLWFHYSGPANILKRPASLSGISGGLLYIAGGLFTTVQAVYAISGAGASSSAVATAVLTAVPILLGILALRISLKACASEDLRSGILMIASGITGFVFWAGYIIGPVLCIVSGALMIFYGQKTGGS